MRKPRIGWQGISVFTSASLALLALAPNTWATPSRGAGQPAKKTKSQFILTDPKLLAAVGLQSIAQDQSLEVALARVTPAQEEKIRRKAHDWRRCAGYERVDVASGAEATTAKKLFAGLREQKSRNDRFFTAGERIQLERNPKVQEAVDQVSEENLKESVTWFSSYRDRYHASALNNTAIQALKLRLEQMSSKAPYPVEVSLVQHTGTRQNSVRLRIPGATKPSEIVVLGAHVDSINHREGRQAPAPGADDNASGSSNLIEAARILLSQPQPQRTIEFYWYAAEEIGLVGSAEIARSYRNSTKDVIGVLQLDMTLHPGNGEFVLASINDFTHPWLRSLLVEINGAYLKSVKIVDDKCGYGCSDHASWHRQGYPALMPTEAMFDDMFPDLHSSKDVINPISSFRHSAIFSKIAVAFALELGNSSLRAPR